MRRSVTILVLLGLSFCTTAQQQDESLSYADQLAALEAELDSLSIFNLIDSLFEMESVQSNELNVRFGFTSSVTSAGRDYNINQTGYSPGLTFYHKKGFYSDLSGYWNSGVEPNYNPTVFAGGYLGSINSKWGYSLDYERWFYNPKDSSDNPLKNSIGGSLSYDLNFANLSVDYSLLFGDETAHRIIGNLSGNISLGKWWVFNQISLFPSINILYGNSSITQLRITREQLTEQNRRQLQILIDFSSMSREERLIVFNSVQNAFENGRITEQQRNQLLFALNDARNLTEEELAELQALIDEGYEVEEYYDGNSFGLMNYSFTLPLSLSSNRWNLLFSYTYSIPVALPGEFFEVDPIGYFAASISYRIPFK